MKVARSVAEVLSRHTTLSLECVDRMYLNVYVPLLQTAAGAAHFFRKMRGAAWPSSVLMAPITERFVNAIKSYAERNRIDLVSFRRGERKDERTQQYLRSCPGGEGVLYIGRAQEKARVLRTERRHDPRTGAPYPWLVDSTAFVNHYYVYAVDDDFGPFFLKFCSYFPYNARLCINGHEYLKRQLTKRGIAFEALDNGILRCDDPQRMQRLADTLTAKRVDALLRKWLARLPHPFTAGDRQQGIRYDVSMLQAEFARTDVFDRPAQGRVFFEEVLRENLDMGRPDHVQLIFDRRVTRRTPTRHRTRVITDRVTPSLHVDYKHSRIKQYHKEGRALRTETGRVDDWRGGGRRMGVAVPGGFRRCRCLTPRRGSVSSRRSSNRTCGFPASGSRTRSCLRPRKARRAHGKAGEPVLLPESLVRKSHILSGAHLVLATEPLAQPPGRVPVNRRVGRADLPQDEVVRPAGQQPVEACHHVSWRQEPGTPRRQRAHTTRPGWTSDCSTCTTACIRERIGRCRRGGLQYPSLTAGRDRSALPPWRTRLSKRR